MRVRKGQRSAQECLVRRWAPRVFAICRARLGHASINEDLAQESLLRALARLDSLKEPDHFGPWLRSIATNVCVDWIRTKTHRPHTVSIDSTDETITATSHDIDTLDRTEITLELRQQIDLLPMDLREPILLFYYDDVTYDQIAETIGVSRATVSARLTKAREILGRKLADLVEGVRNV